MTQATLAPPLLAILGALAGGFLGLIAVRLSDHWVARWYSGEEADSSEFRWRVVAVGVAAGALGGWRLGGDPVRMLTLAACGAALLFLLATDLRVMRIPAVGAAALAMAGLAVAAFAGYGGWQERIAGGAVGSAAAGMLWAVGRIISRRGQVAFGPGDVLLACGVGLAVGISRVLPVLLLGAAGAAIAAIVMIARGRIGPLPWGAWVCAAALVGLAW
jgi:prepilin signal peptidase PulO-like enzyme (type II secretory pathway)